MNDWTNFISLCVRSKQLVMWWFFPAAVSMFKNLIFIHVICKIGFVLQIV